MRYARTNQIRGRSGVFFFSFDHVLDASRFSELVSLIFDEANFSRALVKHLYVDRKSLKTITYCISAEINKLREEITRKYGSPGDGIS